MAKKNEIVKDAPEQTAMVATDYGADAGAGFETLTRDDVLIPFLVVLQPLSPQVQEGDSQYVTGARPGMIFQTVSQRLYSSTDGAVLIPCHRTHHFIEWIPRSEGGGLVDVYDVTDPYVVSAREGKPRFGKIELASGNELVETFSMFSLLVDPDGVWTPVMQAFSSTQIRPYKMWMSRASGLKIQQADGRLVVPPLFAHRWRATTRKQQNDKGIWHGWHIEFDGENAEQARLAPDSMQYLAAREFRKQAVDFATDTIKRSVTQQDPEIPDVPGSDAM